MDVRPDWDKFPGAMYSVAFDTPMPGYRSLQIGTIHEYGENFSLDLPVPHPQELICPHDQKKSCWHMLHQFQNCFRGHIRMIKLIFFDMDGVLTVEKSSWFYVNNRLGINNRENYMKYISGII